MPQDLYASEREAREKILNAAWESLSAKEDFWQAAHAGPFFREDECVRTLVCLGRYFTDRARGLLVLGLSGFYWEAEIILRTIYECTAKILLLSLVDDQERLRLVHEFWKVAPEASDRKIARKAVFAEDVFPEGSPSRDVFRLLYDDRMVRDSRTLNKAERRELERRWSFSEIIERLAQMSVGGKLFSDVRSLLHTYGTASHLAHADHAAMEFMIDRATRPPEELLILRNAHIARIVSDMSSLGMFCAHLAARHLDVGSEILSDMKKANENLHQVTSEYSRQFDDSQKAFYDEMFGRDME